MVKNDIFNNGKNDNGTSNPSAKKPKYAPEFLNNILDYKVDSEQSAIIGADVDANILVMAGAGAGKTDTITNRIVWLIVNGYASANEILGLTFSNKATKEFSERVQERLEDFYKYEAKENRNIFNTLSPDIQTYDSYASSILREFSMILGFDDDFVILNEADQYLFAKRVYEEIVSAIGSKKDILSEEDKDILLSYSKDTIIKSIVSLDSELTSNFVTCSDAKDNFEDTLSALLIAEDFTENPEVESAFQYKKTLMKFVERYKEYKNEKKAITYADQQYLANEIAIDRRVNVAKRYKFVLLDEYQDTSAGQALFLQALFAPKDAENSNDYPQILAVGDSNQAIYTWRGAFPGMINNFHKIFPAEKSITRFLSVSHRNSIKILRAANAIINDYNNSDTSNRFDKDFILKPEENAENGVVKIEAYDTEKTEFKNIVEYVKSKYFVDGNFSEKTIAIISPTRDVFSKLQLLLENENIPTEVVGLSGLLKVREINDLLAVIKCAINTEDDTSLFRIFASEKYNLTPKELLLFSSLYKQSSDYKNSKSMLSFFIDKFDVSSKEFLQLAEKAKCNVDENKGFFDKLGSIRKMLLRLSKKETSTVEEFIYEAIRMMNLYSEAEVMDFYTSSSAKKNNINAFLRNVKQYEAVSVSPSIKSFIQWVDQLESSGAKIDEPICEIDKRAVQLITIHGAKGLEWDYVVACNNLSSKYISKNCKKYQNFKNKGTTTYLTQKDKIGGKLKLSFDFLNRAELDIGADGYDKKEFEEFKKSVAKNAIDEGMRKAYVAYTRAKKELFITGSFYKKIKGQQRELSPFFETVYRVENCDDAWEKLITDSKNITSANDVFADLHPDSVLRYNDSAYMKEQEKDVEVFYWPNILDKKKIDSLLEDSSEEELENLSLKERIYLACKIIESEKNHKNNTDFSEPVSHLLDNFNLLVKQEKKEKEENENKKNVLVNRNFTTTDAVRYAANLSNPKEKEAYIRNKIRPIPIIVSNSKTNIGLIVHEAIENYYLDKQTDDDNFNNSEVSVKTNIQKTPLSKKEKELLEKFYSSRFAGLEPKYTEYPFDFIDRKCYFKGCIDAVFECKENGKKKLIIVDWKTGKVPKDKEIKALQLAIYRKAIMLLDNDIDDVSGLFFYIKDSKEVEFTSSQLDDIYNNFITQTL